jgi:hypothetical protein
VSAFLDLRDAVIAALSAAPALAGGRISTAPSDALPESQPTDIVVTLADSARGDATSIAGQPIDWVTTVRVLCRARASASGDAMAVADALFASAWERVAAMPLPAGVMDRGAEPEVLFDTAAGEWSVATVEFTVQFAHRTAHNTVTAWT